MKHPAPSAALVLSRRNPIPLLLVALAGGGLLLFTPLLKAHAGLFTDETAKAREEMAPLADTTLTRSGANLDQIEADIALAEKNLRQGIAAESSADVDIAAYVSAQTGLQKRLDDVSADLAAIDRKQSYLQGSHKLDEKTDLLSQVQREKVGLYQGRRQADLGRIGSMEALIKLASTRKDDLAKAERRSATHAQALADAQASQAAATASGAHTNQAADYSSATVATAEPAPQPAPAQTTIVVADGYSPPVYYYNGYNPYYPPPYYTYYGRPYYGPPRSGVVFDLNLGGGGHHHHR